ncbi:hypothetical protein [Rufibacter soli]
MRTAKYIALALQVVTMAVGIYTGNDGYIAGSYSFCAAVLVLTGLERQADKPVKISFNSSPLEPLDKDRYRKK